MALPDIEACAAIVCASEIGLRYGFTPETMAKTLKEALRSTSELFVAAVDRGDAAIAEEQIGGFAWIEPRGAFSSAPYLRLIAVDAKLRSAGIGKALMDEFEERTRSVGRDWCLLVSDFNLAAQAFYEKRGYIKAGALPDFAKKGITEILMVKRRQ
jgi:ribosomal protein S18 acetylase RimI-like enzyme